ncbi:TetR/AcrR family transcriptional regulator [Amycolatopsis roodepoortensis]|uniref:TetR/AcrR family transcriptional regulator n=1 Tax=Amycolatopsis TaxID=1813 RepID=UPI0013BE8C3F|nr:MULTISPECIES: TetR/AcrR family transcriptional regulator [Amycolatopsis]UUV32318.1 TetR/AcrR family transcriptional regulator [Amycolatopsis roodepoortensis]
MAGAQESASEKTGGRPRRTRLEDVLDIAEQLFSEQGFKATSMRGIAARMGLKAGSLYTHVSSKDEILWEIVERVARMFTDSAERSARSEGSAHDRLRAFMRGHMRIVAEHRAMASVLLMEWRELSRASDKDIRGMRDAHEAFLKEILDAGVMSGEFRAEHVKWARLLILSALNWSSQWLDPNGPESAEAVADHFFDLVVRDRLGTGEQPVSP